MTTSPQTITLAGTRYVIVPEAEYRNSILETGEPPLPPPDAQGNYPALEAMQALLARDILRGRRAAGLTGVELARRAGIRPETLSRIEKGTHSPSVATVDKIDRVLREIEAAEGRSSPKKPGRKRK
jgi:DNA-binding XRE family transcriptional regulator